MIPIDDAQGNRVLPNVRLGIDVREVCRPVRTGKARWTEGFAHELLERDVPVTLFTDADLPKEWRGKIAGRHAVHRSVVTIPRKGMAWHWAAAQYIKADSDIDLYVSPTSYIVPSLLGKTFPCVPIIHDLIAFRREPHDRRSMIIERLTLGKTIRSAAHVYTVSQATTMDLLGRYHALDPATVTPIFAGPTLNDAKRNVPDGKAIVCIGTLSPRKNQQRLIEAYVSLPSHLRSVYRLVLVGNRGWKDKDILRLARTTDGVEWREYLPDHACQEILSTATVLAFPSLYEGFGMPVLDAMRRGLPVVTSDRGSLKEIAGDAAVFVDPEDTESIAEGLQRLLEDEALRAFLIQRGFDRAQRFTWPGTVDLFLESIAKLSL